MGRPAALVTGCSSGLGLATVFALADNGYDVCAVVRDPVAAVALDGIDRVRVVAGDVRDRAAMQRIVDVHGVFDVLVNNAGIGSFGSVEATSDAETDMVFQTNVFAAVALTRAVLPGMRKCGSGTIVNIGSVDAWLPGRPLRWAYAASKHALGTFSEALALEVACFGIRVRQLDPGFHATRIRQNRMARTAGEATGTEVAMAYAPLVEAVDRAMSAGGDAAAPAEDVAEAVLVAISDREVHPVRRLVGADAEKAVAATRGRGETELAADYWRQLGLSADQR